MMNVITFILWLPCVLLADISKPIAEQVSDSLDKYLNPISFDSWRAIHDADHRPEYNEKLAQLFEFSAQKKPIEIELVLVTEFDESEFVAVVYQAKQNNLDPYKYLILLKKHGDFFFITKKQQPYTDGIYLTSLHWCLKEITDEAYELACHENRKTKNLEIIRNLQKSSSASDE